jgi:hypothetical protein
MISLGLSQPELVEPTEEQLRRSLAEAVRARNLLNNVDFQWWMKKLEEGAQKEYRKLVYRQDEPAKYHERRGTIKSIEKGLDELRLRASEVENLEERLKSYDERTEPVARGA